MYIPAFWCGVAVTVLVEVTAVIVIAVVANAKKKK